MNKVKSTKNNVVYFKFFMLFVLAAFMGSAQSLELSDLDQTWFKVKWKDKGFCEELDSTLTKDSEKEKGYLFITYNDPNLAGSFIFPDFMGEWGEEPINVIELIMGTVNSGVLSIHINEEPGEESFVYLRLVAKEKNGLLTKGKLKTLIGFELEDSMQDKCFLAVKVSGSYVPENKVPEDVKNALVP